MGGRHGLEQLSGSGDLTHPEPLHQRLLVHLVESPGSTQGGAAAVGEFQTFDASVVRVGAPRHT